MLLFFIFHKTESKNMNGGKLMIQDGLCLKEAFEFVVTYGAKNGAQPTKLLFESKKMESIQAEVK